jgi:hypothetical protein
MKETPPSKPSTRDLLLSALIPLYGAIAGLIALSNGQPVRGRTMVALGTLNIFIIVQASSHLLK